MASMTTDSIALAFPMATGTLPSAYSEAAGRVARVHGLLSYSAREGPDGPSQSPQLIVGVLGQEVAT